MPPVWTWTSNSTSSVQASTLWNQANWAPPPMTRSEAAAHARAMMVKGMSASAAVKAFTSLAAQRGTKLTEANLIDFLDAAVAVSASSIGSLSHSTLDSLLISEKIKLAQQNTWNLLQNLTMMA